MQWIVGTVLDMRFSVYSRMLVHALYTMRVKDDKLARKFSCMTILGFLDDCDAIFRRMLGLFRSYRKKVEFWGFVLFEYY